MAIISSMFLTNLIRKFIQQCLNNSYQEVFFPKDDFDTEKLTFHQLKIKKLWKSYLELK